MRKKGDVGVYDSAHAPAKWSRWEKILYYQGRSLRNTAKRENIWHSSENAVGRGCPFVRTKKNCISTTGSTTSPFKTFYWEKPKIIGSFSEFVRIGYVTKRDMFKNQMADKKIRLSWWDIMTIIIGIRTSCTIQKPGESLWLGALSGRTEKDQSYWDPKYVPQSEERKFGSRYRGRRHSYVKTRRKCACDCNTWVGRNSEAERNFWEVIRS